MNRLAKMPAENQRCLHGGHRKPPGQEIEERPSLHSATARLYGSTGMSCHRCYRAGNKPTLVVLGNGLPDYISVKYLRLPELLTDLSIAEGTEPLKAAEPLQRKVSFHTGQWMLTPLSGRSVRSAGIVKQAPERVDVFISQCGTAGWHEHIDEEGAELFWTGSSTRYKS